MADRLLDRNMQALHQFVNHSLPVRRHIAERLAVVTIVWPG
jgi:hypothetical protein